MARRTVRVLTISVLFTNLPPAVQRWDPSRWLEDWHRVSKLAFFRYYIFLAESVRLKTIWGLDLCLLMRGPLSTRSVIADFFIKFYTIWSNISNNENTRSIIIVENFNDEANDISPNKWIRFSINGKNTSKREAISSHSRNGRIKTQDITSFSAELTRRGYKSIPRHETI